MRKITKHICNGNKILLDYFRGGHLSGIGIIIARIRHWIKEFTERKKKESTLRDRFLRRKRIEKLEEIKSLDT